MRPPVTVVVLIALLFVSPGLLLAQKKLTVEAIYGSRELSGKVVSGVQWTPDKRAFTYFQRSENGRLNIWIYDLKSRKRKILIDSEKVSVLQEQKTEKRFTLGNYFWSPNGKEILLPSGNDLYLYEVATGKLRRLTEDEAEERDPRFSPDGKKIAFLKNHNLHVLDVATGETTQLTTQGTEHVLIGRFDWVYEEEFGIRTGFAWSPDGKHIAYWELDENRVPEFPIVDFIPVHNVDSKMRYPKAGDPNSLVRIGVVPVEASDGVETRWMDIGAETDIYIPRIKWHPDGRRLAIYRLNRDQNFLELLLADIATGRSQVILEEKVDNGWIDIDNDFTFVDKGRKFIWPSVRSGWRHYYLYDINGKLIRPLTQGDWEALSLVRVDQKRKHLYFMATEKGYAERHLYRVGFNGKGLRRVTADNGSHRVNMSPDCNYFLDVYSDILTPPKTILYRHDGKKVDVIEPNDIPALKEYQLATPEFVTFKADDGLDLYGYFIKPPDFDPARKYPVLVSIYGGPGAPVVRNAWGGSRFLWHQMLAQKGIVVFVMDNRSSGPRSRDLRFSIYKNLGEVEYKDQVAGVKYLRTLPFVDPERIGIWGWSYGGYMTLMAMVKSPDYFKVGVSVAPVTDWRNYDTIYTERYMLTPEKNPEGYKQSAPVQFADQLKGKLLIIHGSSDDNVHLANTMQMAFALQNARKPFSMMIYPRKLHGIRGRDTRVHLFNVITDFLLENL
jgi:dipeptidyl-peptidase-4